MKKARSSRAKKDAVTIETDDTTCPVCYAEFLDLEDLDVHTEQVHNKGFVRCQFCEKSFQNAEIYILHFRDVHLADVKSCQYCSRVYTDVDAFRKHEITHTRLTPKNKYSCSECQVLFSSVFELTRHEYDNHPTGDGVFLNKYYALLSSVINMKADNVIQAIGKDFIYVCARCKHSDADLRGYIAHLKVKHCRSLACDRCYRVYGSDRAVREHFSKYPCCNNVEPIKKKCKECLKFFDLKTLKHHKKTCKAIKCNSCKQVFDSLFELSEHQRKEHPLAVSLLVCIFCRKECVGSNALEKHIERIHSQEFHLYKYTCSYCETTFKHPKRLFAHYFMKHKDIEPYTCNICNKKFRIRKNFTLHIKLVHSSNGFVEFDEKLHVFFTDKKSEKPFQPVSKYGEKPKNKEINKSTENDELELVNNSDFMNPTDTEGNQTDVNQDTEKHKRKRKTRPHYNQKQIATLISDNEDSEDEPLLVVQKKAKIKNKIKSQLRKTDKQWNKKHVKLSTKKRFTCKICKKYCYTFQNYHNHVSMHFKDESKRCVKCSLSFQSKAELQRHLVDQHSSSKLTETLKNLLERRKKGEQKEEPTMTQKFINTIKAVKLENDTVKAKITPITKEISVQKFIENFTPETTENKVQVKNNISVTKVVAPKRQPLIKMTKFQPAPVINEDNIKLALPVRFKKVNEKHTVTIKEVKDQEYERKLKFYEDDGGGQFQDDYNNEEDFSIQNQKESYIPEAEQEVTLEGTEEVPKKNVATHKIVIPKLPKELKSIRIAHLLPEAPYYKIVKMEEIIHNPAIPTKKVEEEVTITKDEPVQLPDGTKLVHVNPLAHLLGNTPIEDLVKPMNKYYKPKNKNFQAALAKAMQKLDYTSRQSKKKIEKPKAKKTENRSYIEISAEDEPKVEIKVNSEPTYPTDFSIEPEENNDTNKNEGNNGSSRETAVNFEASNQTDGDNKTEVNECYHQTKEASVSLPIIAD